MSTILLAVGGGIAAFKSAALCSRLVQSEHDVRVVMTGTAQQFVGSATFAALSGKPVWTSDVAAETPLGGHIEATRDIDLMVVAPATANLLAKFAAGIADSLVSTCYLQCAAPVLIAPAMSNVMWQSAAVQRNLQTLIGDGVRRVGPEEGWLSCRNRGRGRMSEPETIVDVIEAMVSE